MVFPPTLYILLPGALELAVLAGEQLAFAVRLQQVCLQLVDAVKGLVAVSTRVVGRLRVAGGRRLLYVGSLQMAA